MDKNVILAKIFDGAVFVINEEHFRVNKQSHRRGGDVSYEFQNAVPLGNGNFHFVANKFEHHFIDYVKTAIEQRKLSFIEPKVN